MSGILRVLPQKNGPVRLVTGLLGMSRKLFERYPGFADILEGAAHWQLWFHLGWRDVVRRYRRTALGPFWNTLSVAIFVGVCGFMYAGVFGQQLDDYMPYLSSGFTVWVPIATFINESTTAFVSAEATLRQMRMPLSTYVYAGLVRNVIVFWHNAVVFLFILLLFPVPINDNTWLVFPAIFALCFNAIWVGILTAMLCTRYRDLNQAIGSIMQVMFFVTPIFWHPGQSGRAQQILVDVNPFYHFVDVLRAPMLGKTPSLDSWIFIGCFSLAGWTLTLLLFNKYRNRVVFWL